jgi:signal transduction histidine kinase
MALESIRSLDSDELELLLSRAKVGTDRLAKLVEDILLLVQLDTGQVAKEFEQFAVVSRELGAVVMHTVQRYEPYAMAFDLSLQIQSDPDLPPVRLAEALFDNALGRLVHNAIKYSRGKGKRVAVRVQSTNDGIEVVVSDEGQGIPPEEIPNLFRRFHQVDRPRLQQQGVGLGLTIARELIRLHGGDITVESAPGEGSTFAIRLPVVNVE